MRSARAKLIPVAALFTGAMLTLNACGVDAHDEAEQAKTAASPAEAAPVSDSQADGAKKKGKFDTGEYKTDYKDLNARSGNSFKRIIESSVMSNYLVLPSELDPRFTISSVAAPMANVKQFDENMHNLAQDPVEWVLKGTQPTGIFDGMETDFLGGYFYEAASPENAKNSTFEYEDGFYGGAETAVIRVGKPEQARQVVNALMERNNSKATGELETSYLQNTPDLKKFLRIPSDDGLKDGYVIAVHGEYILMAMVSTNEPMDQFLKTYNNYADAFLAKEPALISEAPVERTVYGYGTSHKLEPVDPDGVLSLTVPLLDEQFQAGASLQRLGERGTIGYAKNADEARQLMENEGMLPSSAERATFVQRYESENFAARDFKRNSLEIENPADPLASGSYEEPQGVPNTVCGEKNLTTMSILTCIQQYGPYVATGKRVVKDKDGNLEGARKELSQLMAAQYELFENAKEAGAFEEETN
ncbi:DUF7373 family lipoprotein [Corynebacterium aquilae]|uniref:DUF7373 domain-containing protein n=1 Tax=Corynebacterium aquilae DSM 44791 TaxID=1431546 RepID=A0A1L7CDJ3_9CORY|nr:hypothetical protein [Corynebacterium aquilae]APT83915.1 hypothetical protein CAQU_01205 [Corynebacterium aquilae DSM 44791]